VRTWRFTVENCNIATALTRQILRIKPPAFRQFLQDFRRASGHEPC